MQHLNIDRVVSSLARRQKLTAALTDFQPVSKSLARVVVTMPRTSSINKYDVRQAISLATNGQATPVENSFYHIDSNGLPAMVGFVRANTTAKPYDKSEVSKMRVMAKNMLMDASDDSLWAVKTSVDGDRMLVRQSQDDLSTLLSAVKASVIRAPRIAQLASVVNIGDAVAFVNPRTETVRCGFVASVDAGDASDALEIVQMPEENNPDEPHGLEEVVDTQNDAYASVSVSSNMVVAAVTMPTRFFSTEVAAPANANNKQALKDYYKKVWSQGNPEFLKRLFENIDRMAAA